MLSRVRWRGLRVKIIAWSFIPTMIILIIVALVIFFAYEDVTEDLVIERNSELARLTASQLMAEMDDYQDILNTESRKADIYGGDPQIQQTALQDASNRLVVFDAGVILLDIHGTVTATEPERLDIVGQDWSDRSYHRQLIDPNPPSFSYSDIVQDGPGGMEVIVVAVPVTDAEGASAGTMAGMFEVGATAVSDFYGEIVKLRIGESGSAYLVDSSGTTIYHTDFDRIGEDFSGRDVVQSLLAEESGAVRTSDSEDHGVVASFAAVPGTSWGLVTQESWDSVMGAGSGYRYLLIGLLALGVIVPTAIVMFGVRRITNPIAEVSGAAREIADGHFDHKISVATGDELEDLADQFNIMASALQESYSTLEQKVEERTEGERRRADQLRAINEVGRRISSILDLDELLPYVASSLQKTFGYYNVTILLLDPASGELILSASAGAYQGTEPMSAESEKGITDSVAESGEPLMVNDVSQESRYCPREELPDTQSELAVPIKMGDRTIGVLDIEESKANAFDELDLFTAETLADQLAVAIENARLYEQAQELATVEERQRLARDLHDAVTQTLFSASLIAEVLPRLWEKNPDEGRRRLEELRSSTRGALAEMRMLLLELRPAALTEVGLGDLLRHVTDAVAGRSGLTATLTVEGEGTLPADVQIALYRIAQEAINNTSKHAGASEATLNLRCQPERVELAISDNGSGFDLQSVSGEHLGLRIMRERAEEVGARLNVESDIGQGTKVRVVWPKNEGQRTVDEG
jgi:nitrate/nitrite-specific signal transduction histidine kinase